MDFEERMQRAMDFVLEQHARTEATIDRLGVRMDQMQTRIDGDREERLQLNRDLAVWIAKVSELLAFHSNRLDRHETSISRLEEHRTGET